MKKIIYLSFIYYFLLKWIKNALKLTKYYFLTGFQNSKVICIKKDTKEEVDEKMCDEFTRPQSFVKSCNIFSCPLR